MNIERDNNLIYSALVHYAFIKVTGYVTLFTAAKPINVKPEKLIQLQHDKNFFQISDILFHYTEVCNVITTQAGIVVRLHHTILKPANIVDTKRN